MTLKRALGMTGVSIALAFAVVGCKGAAPPASLGARQLTTINEIDRMLNSTLTPEEQSLLINAHGAVVEACMQKLGWDFEVGTATLDIAGGGPQPLSRFEQWVFADEASAKSEGYGLKPYLVQRAAFLAQLEPDKGHARIPDQVTMSRADSARYEIDYFGREAERVEILERDGSRSSVPGGGCLGQAEQAVFGDIEQELRLQDARTTAQSDVWLGMLSDGAVVQSLATWKTCIADRGFEYEDPEEAFGAALTAAGADNFEQEHLIATVAADCTVKAGLDHAAQAAYLAAANATLGDLEDDLLAFGQFEKEALARAKAILKFRG